MPFPNLALFLLYMPIVQSIVEDALDAIDVEQLQAAIVEFKDVNESTTDEAQRALADMFDRSLDFETALKDAGVPFDDIGKLLEVLDGKLFYWAIKVKVKGHSRKRTRNMRRFKRKLSDELRVHVFKA